VSVSEGQLGHRYTHEVPTKDGIKQVNCDHYDRVLTRLARVGYLAGYVLVLFLLPIVRCSPSQIGVTSRMQSGM